ncbi:3-phosphoshikimate 1-carboxyvinyltransferase [Balneicella halophila]|uniref:3-phosphoshikimate 1-carboxyvinyltransferase n=1 Tax=Balneicella halophila TaxID=1537566 RepID=A0A7L4UPD4_BALHA|nr:3-phosphoshikimate 1-carboxyvinyltransferase [Balneicella halophila]
MKLSKNVAGSVKLPASKSISNRVLLIRALSYSFLPIHNLSEAEDTLLLDKALNSNTNRFYTGDGGTTFRFITAFLSKIVGEWYIDCSERMKERPVKVLVDALNELGAQITYTEKEGYPPLHILGSNLNKSKLSIDGSISSQYITALLLIAPSLVNGLELKIKGNIASRPYMEMTLKLMEEFGVKTSFVDNKISIAPQDYQFKPFTVEADWSGASYFYELLSLSEKGELFLVGLTRNSLQGDAQQVELWKQLGIQTSYEETGVRLTKVPRTIEKLHFDFSDMPDLVQTFAVVCCFKNIPFQFTGVETLKIKETNRIKALIQELKKFGYLLTEQKEGTLSWYGKRKGIDEKMVSIKTYGDHRMAMAFAPVAIIHSIEIKNPEVVKKSFPDFWQELRKFDCNQ